LFTLHPHSLQLKGLSLPAVIPYTQMISDDLFDFILHATKHVERYII